MPSPESSTVVTLTAADVVAGLRVHTATLLAGAGTDDLAGALAAGLDYQLGGPAQLALTEIGELAFLGGLPPLPCCAAHPDELAVFAASLAEVVAAGSLPVAPPA